MGNPDKQAGRTEDAVPDRPGIRDSSATVLLLLWLVMIVHLSRHVAGGHRLEPVPARLAAVDPNVAPWWELSTLPELGPTTAFEIVRYRASCRRVPAFRAAADLARVRGIGPVTLRRIGSYLQFHDRK